jgi:hypothetical protein
VIPLYRNSETGAAFEPVTYEVEIQYNPDEGVYRVMNPYSNSVYPYADDDCAEEGFFLEFVAPDNESVYVPRQSLGFDWGEGEYSFISQGARYIAAGNSVEDVKGEGYLGTVAAGVISLPVFTAQTDDGDLNFQGVVFEGSSGYYAGTNGKIEVVLPGAAAVARYAARAKAAIGKRSAKSIKAQKANRPLFKLISSEAIVK